MFTAGGVRIRSHWVCEVGRADRHRVTLNAHRTLEIKRKPLPVESRGYAI